MVKTRHFQLRGESKKTFKKDARITWTRNNEPWNPDEDGTDKMNGFIIRYIHVLTIRLNKMFVPECRMQMHDYLNMIKSNIHRRSICISHMC